MRVRAPALDPPLARAIDRLLLMELDRAGVFQIVSPDELDGLLGREKMKEAAGCPPESIVCTAEIVGALGTRFLLVASVDNLGKEILLTMSLIDSKEQVVRARAQTKQPNDPAHYDRAVAAAVEELLRRHSPNAAKRPATPNAPPTIAEPGGEISWTLCPLGQESRGKRCEGTAEAMTWKKARAACPEGHRLPTAQEISRILGSCEDRPKGGTLHCAPCSTSEKCKAMFHGGQPWLRNYLGRYWTASRFEDVKDIVWAADLGAGNIVALNVAAELRVRCVTPR